MSMDMSLIDLDDKIVYDVNGGRNLFLLLSKVSGHKICINDDENGCLDFYAKIAIEKGFKEIDAAYIPETDINHNTLPTYTVLCKNFTNIRFDIADFTREMNRDLDYEYYSKEDAVKSAKDLKEKGVVTDAGFDEELKIPWYSIESIETLYTLMLDRTIEGSKENILYTKLLNEKYIYISADAK